MNFDWHLTLLHQSNLGIDAGHDLHHGTCRSAEVAEIRQLRQAHVQRSKQQRESAPVFWLEHLHEQRLGASCAGDPWD